MGELIDKAKGKIKETAGVVAGDRELEAEGKLDRAKGEVKEKFEEAKQKVKEAVRGQPDANAPARK